jgi:hypothetical protein
MKNNNQREQNTNKTALASYDSYLNIQYTSSQVNYPRYLLISLVVPVLDR